MKITLTDLENVAKALSIKVSYDDLKTSKGGSCRVMETRRIIINKHLQNSEKVNLLAKELGNFDLEGWRCRSRCEKRSNRKRSSGPGRNERLLSPVVGRWTVCRGRCRK